MNIVLVKLSDPWSKKCGLTAAAKVEITNEIRCHSIIAHESFRAFSHFPEKV